jgi:predicted transcriptional regulator
VWAVGSLQALDFETGKCVVRLTPGELKVMRLLWEHGEMKPPQIADLYEPPIKNAALRACLAVLVQKKHVARRREGRAYFYRALTPQQHAFKDMLRELVDNFCDGSARTLMLNLAEQETLSDDDIRQIKTLTSRTESSKKRGVKAKRKGAK